MKTRDLRFFHGTSAISADDILSHGARDALGEIGCWSLAKEIWSTLGKYEAERELNRLFTQAGCESPGPTALRSVYENEDQGAYAYGHFFATLNRGNAYRYAVCNPVRSEFLLVLSDSLRVLKNLGDRLADDIPSRYPAVLRAIETPSPPVVLELTGIDQIRLLTDDGSGEVSRTLEEFLEDGMIHGVNLPASFRIKNVQSTDVIAIHDLRDWSSYDILNPPWQPSDDRVVLNRKTPEAWLACRAQ